MNMDYKINEKVKFLKEMVNVQLGLKKKES